MRVELLCCVFALLILSPVIRPASALYTKPGSDENGLLGFQKALIDIILELSGYGNESPTMYFLKKRWQKAASR